MKMNAKNMPEFCISAGNVALNDLYGEIDYARQQSAGLIEIRFDSIPETSAEEIDEPDFKFLSEELKKIFSYAKKSGLKIIGTKRPANYANKKENTREPEKNSLKRIDFFKHIAGTGLDFIDLELDAVERHLIYDFIKFTSRQNIKTILSVHNFTKTVSLEKTIRYYLDSGFFNAGYFKMADTVKNQKEALQSIEKNIELSKIKNKSEGQFPDFVVFGMGEEGKSTRVTSVLYGSSFSYCSSLSGATAPGQMSAGEFLAKYSALSDIF